MKNVYGKNILVSGATSGIGKCIAENFAKAGYNVIGLGLNADKHIEKIGTGSIKYFSVDVTNVDK